MEALPELSLVHGLQRLEAEEPAYPEFVPVNRTLIERPEQPGYLFDKVIRSLIINAILTLGSLGSRSRETGKSSSGEGVRL